MVQVNANMVFFLPGQLVLNDGFGHDVYAMLASTNFVMLAGQQAQAGMTGDGGHCIGNIFLSGVEVPDEP